MRLIRPRHHTLHNRKVTQEVLWTQFNVLNPLVDKMKEAANRYRWNVITYDKVLYNHGFCASLPNPSLLTAQIPLALPAFELTASAWYNNPRAAAKLQTGNTQTNTGMFHPNALGYTYAYKRLKHHLKKDTGLGDTFRDVFNVDKDDQMEEIALKRDSVRSSKFQLTNDDVALFSDLKVPVNADITVSIIREKNSVSRGCAAINLFDQRGQTLASSTKKATLASTNVAVVRDYSGEGCNTSFNRNDFQGVDGAGLMRKTRSRVTLYAAKDVDCASSATRPVYFGVSSDENLFYDPVTGRGDIPIDNVRDSYSFKGTVSITTTPAAVCAK